MLVFLVIVLVALAPCLFWLWVIYKKDKYAPEPLFLVIRAFFIGALAVIPVALIEMLFSTISPSNSISIAAVAYQSFIVAGLTEEAGKFMAVRLTVYKSAFFEEPADGLVYSAAAALGFAALENVLYLFTYGWEIILVRGLISNLAHVLFACYWGYPLALTKLGLLKHKAWLWMGLAGAVIAHGLFDFLLLSGSHITFLVIPFFIGMVIVFYYMFKHANLNSQYHLDD